MLFPLKNRTIVLIVLAVTIIALVSIILGVYFGLTSGNSEEEFVSPAGVVANGVQCAEIGTDILRKGGTAADAAIATLFCEGILCPHSMGIGGGFLLTHYKRKTKTIETLIAREAAPLRATPDMFVGVDDVTGILAAAVPGELKGYWELHQRYGLLSWRTLIEPSINLCRNGYIVSPHMANALRQTRNRILNSTDLTEIFINPLTLDVWQEGDIITRPKYADTLEIIASEGVDTLYKNGTIAQLLVQDILDMGGIISYNDFLNYAAVWEPAIVSKLDDNKTMYTIPLPGSGHLLSFIMNILTNFITDESLTSHQRIIESFKYAYAKRTELGDPDFIDNIDGLLSNLTNPNYAAEIRNLILDTQTFTDPAYYGANFTFEEDQGTAHISVLAPNGDAVSVTSTINTYFGAKVISPNTGIILNDEMDDFSTPNLTNSFGVPSSPSNYIAPRKRPMSSMCPAIIIDENDNVQMVIGSAGGTQITTSVAYIILRHLIFKEDLNTAMEAARIHHQLMPMVVQYERDFNIDFINGLSGIGHEMQPVNSIATVIAIAIENNDITGKFDTRRGGSYSKF